MQGQGTHSQFKRTAMDGFTKTQEMPESRNAPVRNLSHIITRIRNNTDKNTIGIIKLINLCQNDKEPRAPSCEG